MTTGDRSSDHFVLFALLLLRPGRRLARAQSSGPVDGRVVRLEAVSTGTIFVPMRLYRLRRSTRFNSSYPTACRPFPRRFQLRTFPGPWRYPINKLPTVTRSDVQARTASLRRFDIDFSAVSTSLKSGASDSMGRTRTSRPRPRSDGYNPTRMGIYVRRVPPGPFATAGSMRRVIAILTICLVWLAAEILPSRYRAVQRLTKCCWRIKTRHGRLPSCRSGYSLIDTV